MVCISNILNRALLCFMTNDHGEIIHPTGDTSTLCYAMLSELWNRVVHIYFGNAVYECMVSLPILYSTAFPKYIMHDPVT